MLEADGATLDDVDLVNVDFDLVPAVDLRPGRRRDGRLLDARDDPGRARGLPGRRSSASRSGACPTTTSWCWSPARRRSPSGPSSSPHSWPPSPTGTGRRRRSGGRARRPGGRQRRCRPRRRGRGSGAPRPRLVRRITAFGHQDPTRWTAYAAWMAERGLIPADLDANAAFVADLIPADATPPRRHPGRVIEKSGVIPCASRPAARFGRIRAARQDTQPGAW